MQKKRKGFVRKRGVKVERKDTKKEWKKIIKKGKSEEGRILANMISK